MSTSPLSGGWSTASPWGSTLALAYAQAHPDRVHRLAGLPATLIHGRRDVIGPAVIPWRLHQAWPGSELIIDEGEGHGGHATAEAWTAANIRHAGRISSDAG